MNDPRVLKLYEYVDDVLTGNVICGLEVHQACQRAKEDLQKSLDDPSYPYWFDPEPALKFEKFCSHFHHLEGPLGGTPFILMPWQMFVFGQILGWKTKKGHRRFRQAHVEVPRGNGKSFMASALNLWMLTMDGEQGPQVYSAATSQKQARVVFDKSLEMLKSQPKFMRYLGCNARTHDILFSKKKNGRTTKGIYKALASNGHKLDGLNIHCAVIDELHAISNRLTYDKLVTGAGKRNQSLIIAITTAGFDFTGIGYVQNEFARHVLNGSKQAERFFCCIWKADDSDPEYSVETLKKANPCWSVLDQEYVTDLMRKAETTSSERASYLTLHLNKWQSGGDKFFDIHRLRTGYDESLTPEQFKHLPCYVGVDMAMVDDMACVTQCFFDQDRLYVFPHYFLPQETVQSHKNARYPTWHSKGLLTAIQGPIIEPQVIHDHIVQINEEYDVQTNVIDRAGESEILRMLDMSGWPVFHAERGYLLSNPTKKLQSLILQCRVSYDNEIFEWNCQNTRVSEDKNNNLYAHKEQKNSRDKIDGVMCVIYCLGPMIDDQVMGDTQTYFSIPE